MEAPTGYHLKVYELCKDVGSHGFGEIVIHYETLKDGVLRVDLIAGKKYRFHIKQETKFDKYNVL